MNDNVRKIFDMLGVEPNEKFKVNGYTPLYYIDEELKMFNYDLVCEIPFLIGLLNGKLNIIKLPKKKKLRDLTEEELQKWTEKNCKYSSRNLNYCDKCIFNKVACYNSSRSWLNHKELYSDKFLDQEIEVE